MEAADTGWPGRLPSAGAAGCLTRSFAEFRAPGPHALCHPLDRRRAAGLGGPDSGVGSRVPTLRNRLPADLGDAPSGPDFEGLPFTPLYLTDDEFAAEIANQTMHGVLHLGWVQDHAGGYHGQMAVLVKPNGALGSAYMAAIAPFRHLLVYPPLLRGIGRTWRARTVRNDKQSPQAGPAGSR